MNEISPPTFKDFFRSFYYENTYLPRVDLSDKALSEHLLEKVDKPGAEIVQRLMSNPEVQKVFSEPLSYDLEKEIPEKNEILKRHGFDLLCTRKNQQGEVTPYYDIVEHPHFQGRLIKSGAARVPEGQLHMGPCNQQMEVTFYQKEESLLRIALANRIREVAKKLNIDVVVPEEKLVAYANVDGITDLTRKYCLVCEKIEVLSVDDTIEYIASMDEQHQRELAKNISKIAQEVGLVDASFRCIRLTPEGKLAFIDTEPAVMMIAEPKNPSLWNRVFGPKGASVQKCARIGLFTFLTQIPLDDRLKNFRSEVIKHYHETYVNTLNISYWKIVKLTVLSAGLIHLIYAISALVYLRFAKKEYEISKKMDDSFDSEGPALTSKSVEERQRKVKEYKEKRTPHVKRFYEYIEGVPYTLPPVA